MNEPKELPLAQVRIEQRDPERQLARLTPRDMKPTVNGVELPWIDFVLTGGIKQGCLKIHLSFFVDRLEADAQALVELEKRLLFPPSEKGQQ